MQAEVSQRTEAHLMNLSDRYEELKDHISHSLFIVFTDIQKADRALLGPHATTVSLVWVVHSKTHRVSYKYDICGSP